MSFLNKDGNISYADVRQYAEKLKQNLKDKYTALDSIVKDFNTTTVDMNQNSVGLTTSTALEDYVSQIENLFSSGIFNGNIQINGSLIVDQIQVSDLLVKTSNNLNITKVLESSFGDQFTTTGATDIVGLIQAQDLKLKNQTITNSTIVDSLFRNGTIENAYIKNPIGLTGATVVDTTLLNSYLQSYGIANTGDPFFDIKTETKVGTSFNKQTGITISGKVNTDTRADLFRLAIINTDATLDSNYSKKLPYVDVINPTSDKSTIVQTINTNNNSIISSIYSDVDQIYFNRQLSSVSLAGNKDYFKFKVDGYDVDLVPGKGDSSIRSRVYIEADSTVHNSMISVSGLTILQGGLSVNQISYMNVISVGGNAYYRQNLSVGGVSLLDTTSVRSSLSISGATVGSTGQFLSWLSVPNLYSDKSDIRLLSVGSGGIRVNGEGRFSVGLSVANTVFMNGDYIGTNGLLTGTLSLQQGLFTNTARVSNILSVSNVVYTNGDYIGTNGILTGTLSVQQGLFTNTARVSNILSVSNVVYTNGNYIGNNGLLTGTLSLQQGLFTNTARVSNMLSVSNVVYTDGDYIGTNGLLTGTLSVYTMYAHQPILSGKKFIRSGDYDIDGDGSILSVSTGLSDWYIHHTKPTGVSTFALSIHSSQITTPFTSPDTFPTVRVRLQSTDPIVEYIVYRNDVAGSVITLPTPVNNTTLDILCLDGDTVLF